SPFRRDGQLRERCLARLHQLHERGVRGRNLPHARLVGVDNRRSRPSPSQGDTCWPARAQHPQAECSQQRSERFASWYPPRSSERRRGRCPREASTVESSPVAWLPTALWIALRALLPRRTTVNKTFPCSRAGDCVSQRESGGGTRGSLRGTARSGRGAPAGCRGEARRVPPAARPCSARAWPAARILAKRLDRKANWTHSASLIPESVPTI